MITKNEDIGSYGEKLVENFFDSKFSTSFSFPNPKTKDNAQITDVLIWMNRVVLLIEVKTRNQCEGTASIAKKWGRTKQEDCQLGM